MLLIYMLLSQKTFLQKFCNKCMFCLVTHQIYDIHLRINNIYMASTYPYWEILTFQCVLYIAYKHQSSAFRRMFAGYFKMKLTGPKALIGHVAD